MITYFWILWGFDFLIALVVIYFFIVGLADGSVSSQNFFLWLLLLGAVAAILLIGLLLKSTGILWLLATPGLFYLFFLLVIVIGKPRWN